MKRIVQILLIACLILIGSTSVLAKSSDNQNSITKRIEAAKLVRINWIKAFHYEPIVTLEGPNKTTLVLESVQLTRTQWMRVLWEGTNKELKALGFKKVIFVQQRYNAREFQGWVHDIDHYERTLEKERADKIKERRDKIGGSFVKSSSHRGYTTYHNDKFGYQIDYPQEFVKYNSREVDKVDKDTFLSPDKKTMLQLVGGENRGTTLMESYDDNVKGSVDGEITLKTIKDNWYAITWRNKIDNIQYLNYLKMYVGNGQGASNGFMFGYPEQEKDKYEKVFIILEKSFIPGDIDRAR